jgi:hypothetical protein
MQKVGSNLTQVLTSPNTEEKQYRTVVEFYVSDAEPSASGFDPRSADYLFGAVGTEFGGFKFLGAEYNLRAKTIGDVTRTMRKELSSFSVTLMNDTREVIDIEYLIGFEGLVCVVRLIDRKASDSLENSIVIFTGRCEKPDTFSRDTESVKIEVKQILSATEVPIPRRKFTPNDDEGRSPSDPLFEGFRYVQRQGQVTYRERVLRGGFLGAIGLKKWVTRTMQYSSHSDIDSEQCVPLALGRVQFKFIIFASQDKGVWIEIVAFACEGEVAGFENIRTITPGFYLPTIEPRVGLPGGTGDQLNYHPDWAGSGIYSRLAWATIVAKGTTIESDDPAPEIVGIVNGLKIPLPGPNKDFSVKAWSDNPVYQSRWVINSKDFFNLSNNWFDNEEIIEEADYCNHVIRDQSNTDTVLLQNSQIGRAGINYRHYRSSSSINSEFFRGTEHGIEQPDMDLRIQEVDYQYYDDIPYNSDDWTGSGQPVLPPVKYRKRASSNVLLGEEQKAIDFLFDVIFPAANLYLVQKASGKLSIRAARPADFGFVRQTSQPGTSEIKISNINPFAADPGCILIGANLMTSEVRRVTGTRYDASVSIPIQASGGVSASSASLTGGSSVAAPQAILTVNSLSFYTINIDGFEISYTASASDSVETAAGMLAGIINSHNELNKYVKASWSVGSAFVTVSSRIGFLDLDAPLENIHNAAIDNPATAPVLSAVSGLLPAGTYLVAYSFETPEGETLPSPYAQITLTGGQNISIAAVTPAARVERVNWYVAVEPNGVRTRLMLTNSGAGWIVNELPSLHNDVEPIVNSTAAECHRIAIAFTDKGSTAVNRPTSNMLKGGFKFPQGKKQKSTNIIEISYREASEDFSKTKLTVVDSRHIKKVKKKNILKINGAAIDNYSQARRIANQQLAIHRDGDFFHTLSSDNEALLLEEGDIVAVTDESGRFVNEPVRIEDLVFSDLISYPKVSVTGRKYRRRFYDDQIQERLVPLPLIVNNPTNTEQQAPVIWQYSAATNTEVKIGVNGYTDSAKFRKVEVSGQSNMAGAVEVIIEAASFANGLLPPIQTVTKLSEAAAVTRYFRMSHSSNGFTFGSWSNVIPVIFAAADGTGGSTGGGETGVVTPGGGGYGGSCFTERMPFRLITEETIPFVELYERREFYINKPLAKAFDKKGNSVGGVIEDVFRHPVKEYLIVTFSDGERHEVTAEHKYYVEFEKSVGIGRIAEESGSVLNDDNSSSFVVSVEKVVLDEPIWVYNCRIGIYRNYTLGRKKVSNRKDVPAEGVIDNPQV